MKKLALLFVCLLSAVAVFAQEEETTPAFPGNRSEIFITPDFQYYSEGTGFVPFGPQVGYAIYGSRYRKASSKLYWGKTLCLLLAPAGAIICAFSADNRDSSGVAVVGGIAAIGSLSAGIPLWVKGRREMDLMLDDYVKRYAPKPNHASLSAGPTANGIGLALNF
jgi:hypothetical protein